MLPAGYLSRAFMKGCELTLAEQVVDRIHTDHFFSVPDHQLNETQRERFLTQLKSRNQRENYLKGILTRLLYACGDAQRTDHKNRKKKNKQHKSRRYRYVRG